MTTDRIHRAMSDDGTQIVGRVHGQGRPLVLVPGGPGDGEFSFRFLIPALAEHFTCYSMSTRGKGLSAGHPDHSIIRLVEDVRAFVDSIAEPVALFGHSSGATLALEVADRTDAVTALALYEPGVFDVLSDDQIAEFQGAFAHMAQAVTEGRMTEAARIFFERAALANDAEMQAISTSGVFELVAPNLPSMLQQVAQSGPPTLSDPGLLGRISVPVLLLLGTHTHPIFGEAVQYLTERLPDVRLADIAGAGHLGPQLAPDLVAEAVIHSLAPSPVGGGS